ncbi:MAG: GAF domain-containing protein [Chloroflexi bacterium]|nr:GAF domain-containing protein [Chloroflexota bacterium]
MLETIIQALPAVAFAAVVVHEREQEADWSRALLRGQSIQGTALRALTIDLEASASTLGTSIPPEAAQGLARQLGLEVLSAYPLDSADRRIGFILVGRDAFGVFSTSDQAALRDLRQHAALVLENCILRRQAARSERRRREVEALFAVVGEITSRLDLDAVLASVVRHARDLIGARLAYLALLDEERQDFYVRATLGERTDELAAMRLSLAQGLGAIAARERVAVYVPDILNDPRRCVEWERVSQAEGIRAVLVAPLCVDTRLVGTLFVANRHVTEFTGEDGALLTGLADIAAVAIENVRLYERERQAAAQLQRLGQANAVQYAAAQLRVTLYESLIEAALSGDGMLGITEMLARLLQCPIIVEDCFHRMLAYGVPEGESTAVPPGGLTPAAGAGGACKKAWRVGKKTKRPYPKRTAVPASRKETTVELSITTREELKQAYWEEVEAAMAAVPADGVAFSTLEERMEAAIRAAGRRSLELVVAQTAGTGRRGRSRPCRCGGQQETRRYGTRTVQTVLGAITVERAAYDCAPCGATEYPLDTQIGLPAETASPAVQARLSRCCALEPFVPAVAVFAELTGVAVSAKRAQRTSEALGVAVAAQQTPAAGEAAHLSAGARPVARLYLGVDGVL